MSSETNLAAVIEEALRRNRDDPSEAVHRSVDLHSPFIVEAESLAPPLTPNANQPSLPPKKARTPVGVIIATLGSPETGSPITWYRHARRLLQKPRIGGAKVQEPSRLLLAARSFREAHSFRRKRKMGKRSPQSKVVALSLSEKLAAAFGPFSDQVIVDWAACQGGWSINSRLEGLVKGGCSRILIVPLYPHYASSTTGVVCDEVFLWMIRQPLQPALRILPAYHDDPLFIETLGSFLKTKVKELPFKPDAMIASYLRAPRHKLANISVYEDQCRATTKLLSEQLGKNGDSVITAFHSAFFQTTPPGGDGAAQAAKALAKKGVRNLILITPGLFAESHDLSDRGAVATEKAFKRHGGKNFATIPCLNDSEAGSGLLVELVRRELRGWIG